MSFKSNIYEGIDIAWLFCKEDWKQGRIILPPITDSTGYILVSDQQNNSFHIYSREGEKSNPNNHAYIKTVYLSTNESDGSDVTSLPLNQNFRKGIFVAMSADSTFQYYRWEDIMKSDKQ